MSESSNTTSNTSGNTTSTTASIARDVISASEASSNTPASSPTERREARKGIAPWEIEEARSLVADDASNPSRLAAAVELTRRDSRPFVRTAQRMIRRAHDDGGSVTSRTTREMGDMAKAFADRPVNPKDRRNIALHRFAADINASTHEPTLPSGGSLTAQGSDEWHQSADAIIEAIAQRVRDRRGREMRRGARRARKQPQLQQPQPTVAPVTYAALHDLLITQAEQPATPTSNTTPQGEAEA